MGDPLELQRVTQLICKGDDGIEVVLCDVKDLVTRHNISFITLLKGAPPSLKQQLVRLPSPADHPTAGTEISV